MKGLGFGLNLLVRLFLHRVALLPGELVPEVFTDAKVANEGKPVPTLHDVIALDVLLHHVLDVFDLVKLTNPRPVGIRLQFRPVDARDSLQSGLRHLFYHTIVPFITLLAEQHVADRDGVARLDDPFGNGGDTPESGYEALYQIASGEGLDPWIEPYEGDGAGGVGFREGALHVVVHVTDAPSHDTRSYAPAVAGAHGPSDALAALRAIDARVLGIASSRRAEINASTGLIHPRASHEQVWA